MKPRYRLFRRQSGIYFLEDCETRKQESLKTRDKTSANRLLHARNEAFRQPAINLEIARAYLMMSDPQAATRSWQSVMDAAARTKRGDTKLRWERAMKEKPFDTIRHVNVIQTRPEHFLHMLESGTVCTNIFLRRLHNFALDMDWIAKAIIPRKQWPRIDFREKRGITAAEHQSILAGERNPEWRAYYQVLWHVGGAQSDVANLCAEDVNWEDKVISFHRMKTGSVVQLHFGTELAGILSDLPGQGLLFPRLARMSESDRASLFRRRCRLVGVSGVSLHCFRYSWAERARVAGYPERFAQEALGHGSKAVARAYARKALVKIPALEEYESRLIQKH